RPLSSARSIDHAIIGRPANNRIFLRGMRLDPPLAGMTAILNSASQASDSLDHSRDVSIRHPWEQGDTERPLIVVLCNGQIALTRSQMLPIPRLKVHRNVMNLRPDPHLLEPRHRLGAAQTNGVEVDLQN